MIQPLFKSTAFRRLLCCPLVIDSAVITAAPMPTQRPLQKTPKPEQKQASVRTSRGISFRVLALLLLARIPSVAQTSSSVPVAVIPFQLAQNHIYISASVNGSPPLWMRGLWVANIHTKSLLV